MFCYIVVTVRRGIPEAVEAFTDLLAADNRVVEIRKGLNLNDDETGIFCQNKNGEFDRV